MDNFKICAKIFLIMGINWFFEILNFIVNWSTRDSNESLGGKIVFYITDIVNLLQGIFSFNLIDTNWSLLIPYSQQDKGRYTYPIHQFNIIHRALQQYELKAVPAQAETFVFISNSQNQYLKISLDIQLKTVNATSRRLYPSLNTWITRATLSR